MTTEDIDLRSTGDLICGIGARRNTNAQLTSTLDCLRVDEPFDDRFGRKGFDVASPPVQIGNHTRKHIESLAVMSRAMMVNAERYGQLRCVGEQQSSDSPAAQHFSRFDRQVLHWASNDPAQRANRVVVCNPDHFMIRKARKVFHLLGRPSPFSIAKWTAPA